jgi:hypothetical protein
MVVVVADTLLLATGSGWLLFTGTSDLEDLEVSEVMPDLRNCSKLAC